MTQRRRILLSAFACDPKIGSEPYVGWNWAAMLADAMDVHVITRTHHRGHIAADELAERVRFHYFDLPFCRSRDHHWRFIKPYYLLWQLLAVLFVRRLNRRYCYDIIQHLTYNTIDVPGFLWLCRGPLFVWGPVGGGQTAPHALRAVYGAGWWKERLRAILKRGARYNPVVRVAARRASLILFANAETADCLAGLPRKSISMLETAISEAPLPDRRMRRSGPVRILWLSHVFRRKGLMLAIDGFIEADASCPADVQIELQVVGDGPALPQARRQAERSASRSRIKIVGGVALDEVQRQMLDADIFLFTSVQDTSGNVVLEAMRSALPVVALDHQGARTLLAGECGRLIEIGTYDETRRRIARALVDLAGDPDLRRALGKRAHAEAVGKHTWAAKKTEVLRSFERLFSEIA